MGFGKDILTIADKMMVDVDEVRQAVSVELFSAVVNDTPVDEGRAQGNWQTSTSNPVEGVIDRMGPTAAIEEIERVVAASFEEDVYLTNNLPYIEPLEFGHSDQAPAGMVRKNMLLTLENVKTGAKNE